VKSVNIPGAKSKEGPRTAPSRHRPARQRTRCEHVVQFYNDDDVLLDSVTQFVAAALALHDGVIVLATAGHRETLERRLESDGCEWTAARVSGGYVSLDAGEILAQLMVDGQPDRERFADVVGGLIERVLSVAPRVSAFGELVSLLWAADRGDAAVALEKIWNEWVDSHPLSLHCAYAISDLGKEAARDYFTGVCAEHHAIIHSPNYFGASIAGAK
jgi:hypothetical protein